MSDAKTTSSVELFTCPACEQAVHARVTYSIALSDKRSPESRTVDAKLTTVGLAVAHDCTPKVTR